MIELVGGGGGVKQVARGLTAGNGTFNATTGYYEQRVMIPKVNLERASLFIAGSYATTTTPKIIPVAMLDREDSFILRYSVGFYWASVAWEVVEWRRARVQRGVWVSGGATAGAELIIDPVKPGRSHVHLNYSEEVGMAIDGVPELVLQPLGNRVRFRRRAGGGSGVDTLVYFEVIEHG